MIVSGVERNSTMLGSMKHLQLPKWPRVFMQISLPFNVPFQPGVSIADITLTNHARKKLAVVHFCRLPGIKNCRW
jgi:hypothetical protein